MKTYYNDLNSFLRRHFGCRVHKLTVDAGLSCPNRDGTLGRGGCIYCNAKGSGTGAFARGRSVTAQLTVGMAAVARRYKARKFIAYFQSFSNTYAPLPQLQRLWDEALAVPDVVGLAIGTRPDCVADPVLDLLENYARRCMVWVEYGLQSAHDRTLRAIHRGHDLNCFLDAVSRTRNRGIRICVHVILGLPGETRRDMLETARVIAPLGLDGIKLHLLYVVRGTPLEVRYRQNAYQCLEQTAYADLVCDFIERLPPEMVIQRVTGDPHPDELVAPQWALDKPATMALIQAGFARRGSRQATHFDPHALSEPL